MSEAKIDLLDDLIRGLLSFCDASNWDSDGKTGVEFIAWTEATDQIREIAMDYMAMRSELTDNKP